MADNFDESALFGQQTEVLLRRQLSLSHGGPLVDTSIRVFERPDVARFNACFMAWTQEIILPGQADQIYVNGLSQVAGAGKGQELGSVPDLLTLLDLRGAWVSLDAAQL